MGNKGLSTCPDCGELYPDNPEMGEHDCKAAPKDKFPPFDDWNRTIQDEIKLAAVGGSFQVFAAGSLALITRDEYEELRTAWLRVQRWEHAWANPKRLKPRRFDEAFIAWTKEREQ